MITFERIDNRFMEVNCSDIFESKTIEAITSFQEPNPEKFDDYTKGNWDGYYRFFDKENRVPIGLMDIFEKRLTEQGFEFEVKGLKPIKIKKYQINENMLKGITLRDYQVSAIQKILIYKVGVIEASVGSGKTEIAIGTAKQLKAQTLFLVTSTKMVYQTRDRFIKRGMKNIGIICGDSVETDSKIIVANIQKAYSLIKRNSPEFYDFLNKAKLIVFDECHHSSAKSWVAISNSCDAEYRVFLSGTPYYDNSNFDDTDFHHKDLYMKSVSHKTIAKVPFTFLRDIGVLFDPYISMIYNLKPRIRQNDWHSVYKQGISENKQRNLVTTRLCTELLKIESINLQQLKEGIETRLNIKTNFDKFLHINKTIFENPFRKIMILVERIEHGKELLKLLNMMLPIEFRNKVKFATGTSGVYYLKNNKICNYEDTDDKIVDEFEQNEIDILIGSPIFNEAVDIPSISALIIAGGLKSSVIVIQRIGRGIRFKDGALPLIPVFDFIDLTHNFLRKHSDDRIARYSREGYLSFVGDTFMNFIFEKEAIDRIFL